MNSIKAILDKSDYENYNDFLNFQVDGYWLDEKLEELYPGNMYKGTIPTLLFDMEIDEESKIVWSRILPEVGRKTICPILMCPDDCDFSCTLIDAEIENTGTTIKWNKIGIDHTKEFEPEKIGSTVEWFGKIEQLEFKTSEYKGMLNEFRRYFEINKQNWVERNRGHLKKQEKKNYEDAIINKSNRGENLIKLVLVLSSLILSVLLIKNSRIDRTPIFHPFDVNLNVTRQSLTDNEYKLIPEDVPLLGKYVGDTLIYYQLNVEYSGDYGYDDFVTGEVNFEEMSHMEREITFKNTDVYWRYCQIKINEPDSIKLITLIKKYGGNIISDWNMNKPEFFVQNIKNDLIFKCSLGIDSDGNNVLRTSFEFP